MVRNMVLVVGGVLLATGLVAMINGSWPAALLCLAWGAIFVFGIIYERYAYKTITDKIPDGKGWTRTNERFVDPGTGKTVTVYVKSFTGERAYVAEKLGAPAVPPPAADG
jgi:hypothetical protein